MKIEAVCTRVTSRPYTNQRGVTTTYYDATWMDAEADPMKRFPGLVYTKPTEEDIKTHCIGEGSRLTMHVLKVLEVRNGDPLVIPKYEAPQSKKPA